VTYQPQPGDIGLSGVKAQGVVSLAIKLGSVLRHEKGAGAQARAAFFGGWAVVPVLGIGAAVVYGRPFAALLAVLCTMVLTIAGIVVIAAVYGFRSRNKTWFSHSFIVHHVDPATGVWITESHAKGVETRKLHYKPGDYVWLKTSSLLAGPDDAAEMRAFLDSVTAARWKYDYGTFAGLAIYAITGAFLAPAGVGTAICSGLTSEALQRGRAIWPLTAYRMMPQDQYFWACRERVEIVETA
jgi:hypothetical protein